MFVAASVILLAIFIGSLARSRVQRWQVTVPMVMVLAGIVCGWQSSAPLLDQLSSPGVERAVEIVLALLLFLDATEVRSGWRATLGPLLRLVLVAVPLSLFMAVIAVTWLWPGKPIAFGLVLACVAIPTDMAPISRLLSDERVPQRLRDVLNTESGYNDGIVAPAFLVAEEMLKHQDGSPLHSLGSLASSAAGSIALALVVGAVSGMALKNSVERGWAVSAQTSVATLAVPLFAYAVAVSLGLNGFLAAFVAGLAFRGVRGPVSHRELELTEGVSTFASMALWFVFGQVAQLALGTPFHWRAVMFSLLCLTVLRIAPVLVALTPSSIPWSHRFIIGWAGPRGIASIVFALLALPVLTTGQQDIALDVLVVTVITSVVAHGFSTPLIAQHFDSRDNPARAPQERTSSA